MAKHFIFKIVILSAIIFIGLQFFIVTPLIAQNMAEQRVTIKIDKIVRDESIKGKVANLKDPQNYKVLVYVHTDKWYLHPYKGLDEGRSWAAIKKDASWSIPTKKREWKANKIAALVVDSNVAESTSSPLENLEKIRNHAFIVYTKEEMKQKEWYGKL